VSVPVRRAVDAGCGTGNHLAYLAWEGVACVGFDPDPTMVSLAVRKLAPFPSASVVRGGFADLVRLVAGPVDLVLCLGNSLVHVPQDEVRAFLADAASVVRPGGFLFLQILNYDRLLAKAEADLPLIRGGDGAAELRRRYAWVSRGKLRFQTVLRLSGAEGPVVRRNEIDLFPLYSEDLWNDLERTGFEPAYFGGYDRSPFHADAEALVCLARRSGNPA
jgi:glycine/sarcosine N-methyltransferase